ncbi:MAG TPA: hypothetical protein VGR28_13200 [Candidatus Thermoplasmatota archaeon]|jgi:hypothetical protein|nr:hypothetical protein [Candidatus Thermoplasmatota archaeon]
MRAWVLAAALLALAAPAVAHHDGDEPDFTDASGDAGAAANWGDLAAGWFEDTPAAVEVQLQVAKLPAAGPSLYAWVAVADIGGATFFWGAYYDAPPTEAGFVHGLLDRSTGEALDLRDGEGAFAPGEPGTLNATLPKAYVVEVLGAPLPAGTIMTHVGALSGQAVGGGALGLNLPASIHGFDDAAGPDIALTASAVDARAWWYTNETAAGPSLNATSSPAPAPAGPQRVPGPELTLVAAVALGVALVGRRR